MRIRDIYLRKGNFFVSLVMAAICVVVTIVSFVVPDTYNIFASTYPIQYPWQILSGMFLHGDPTLTAAVNIGHLIFNLLLVLSFGLMIEKILGSKKFALLTIGLWLVYIATFNIIAVITTPEGEKAYGAGISGVAFAYGIMGLYSLFLLAKKSLKRMFKQVSFYLLMNNIIAMLVMVNPFVAGVSSMIVHIVAIIAGIIGIAFFRKTINNFLDSENIS